MRIGLSLPWFLRVDIAEIGGGYLMWLWLREGRSVCYGGAFTLLSLIWAGAWTAPRRIAGMAWARRWRWSALGS